LASGRIFQDSGIARQAGALLPENWTIRRQSFPVVSRGWEGVEDDEGIKVFGGAEGIYSEAWQRRHGGGGYLPEGGDQQATYFNWKK